MTVFGSGTKPGSCYVSDLVDGLYRLMQSGERYPVNLGNPCEMTILEFAERIRSYIGSRSGNRLPCAAGRRPQKALSRHRQGAPPAGLGAARVPGGGVTTDG